MRESIAAWLEELSDKQREVIARRFGPFPEIIEKGGGLLFDDGEELAEAIVFLCARRSSYVTGQVLAVDGGFDAAGIGLETLRGERRNL